MPISVIFQSPTLEGCVAETERASHWLSSRAHSEEQRECWIDQINVRLDPGHELDADADEDVQHVGAWRTACASRANVDIDISCVDDVSADDVSVAFTAPSTAAATSTTVIMVMAPPSSAFPSSSSSPWPYRYRPPSWPLLSHHRHVRVRRSRSRSPSHPHPHPRRTARTAASRFWPGRSHPRSGLRKVPRVISHLVRVDARLSVQADTLGVEHLAAEPAQHIGEYIAHEKETQEAALLSERPISQPHLRSVPSSPPDVSFALTNNCIANDSFALRDASETSTPTARFFVLNEHSLSIARQIDELSNRVSPDISNLADLPFVV